MKRSLDVQRNVIKGYPGETFFTAHFTDFLSVKHSDKSSAGTRLSECQTRQEIGQVCGKMFSYYFHDFFVWTMASEKMKHT
jgi:hypothetical protein